MFYYDRVQADAHVPTYDELLAENIRLKNGARRRVPGDPHTAEFDLDVDHNCDMFERYLFETVQQTIVRSDFDSRCILFPVRDSSKILIDYDKTWNSWVHYAVQYPEFDQEHELFWEQFDAGMLDGHAHPSWLALYFAVLAVRIIISYSDERRP
ncbi:hypothetical protein LTR84_001101 [Exophiala bonariae]|uniref:Uncharacterized protein n=1 Tax=Exophiala bonariae TaxID=1690606 RepID=A0AAV9NSV9_9EURO|nr:hypothetical protein LTR84_001101 [Exophiala bonariae]